MPERDNPIARRHDPKVNDYVARLMDRLDIGARFARAAGGGRRAHERRRTLAQCARAPPPAWRCSSSFWRPGNGDPACSASRSFIVPPLSMVAAEFVHAWQFDHLLLHTGVTVAEVLAGFILGSLLGAFVGYLLGMSPTAELALSPYILALQIAPKVAFAPLFILWMGFTVYPKILVAILIVFFPVMVNVLTAVRTVDPDLINLARAFKATRAQIFWKIEFPTSMPPMFAGLRIGATLAVVGVVVGELVGGNVGLGYLLTFGEGQANTPLVFVSIVMLTVVGGIAYLGVILVERRVLHYLPARASAAISSVSLPLWGGAGVGVGRSHTNVDECSYVKSRGLMQPSTIARSLPTPTLPSPQGGGLRRKMLGVPVGFEIRD